MPGAGKSEVANAFQNADIPLIIMGDVIREETRNQGLEANPENDYAEEVIVVCVHASPKIRYSRLQERNREDAPSTWEVFRERDIREVSVGLGGVIALSDIMLINEGTIDMIRNSSKELVEKLT